MVMSKQDEIDAACARCEQLHRLQAVACHKLLDPGPRSIAASGNEGASPCTRDTGKCPTDHTFMPHARLPICSAGNLKSKETAAAFSIALPPSR